MTDLPTDKGAVEESGQPSAEDERVAQLLTRTIDLPVLASAVEQQEPADAADTLEDLTQEDTVVVLERMEEQSAAEALAEMQRPMALLAIEDLLEEDRPYASRLLTLMAPDDAADLLQDLEPPARESLLALMPAAAAAALRRLVGYPPESAGGLMTTDVLMLRAGMTVDQAIEVIRRQRIPEGQHDLPVADGSGRLVGMIGLRELLLGRPEERVAALMNDSVRVAKVTMDREEVAREFDRYDHAMLPVVDEGDRLLGVVTVDDIIDIIRDEQTEDVQKTVGAGAGEAVYSGLGVKVKGRFPWLGASLLMSAAAALVVIIFEDLIRQRPILAFLMPVIAALVGNAGHQALAVTLRGIILDEVRPERVAPLVLREWLAGLLNGAVLGTMLWLGVIAMSHWVESASPQVGAIAGIATTVAMSVGTLAGTSVPLIMRRAGVDPAHASAIFMIMITDAAAFSVLLGLTFLVYG